ncbi:MAG: sulfatase-like hydrolase/transferase [Sphingomonas sp.]|uniref:sulfatase-like hydrolase/transferase n=1 Tax=Sphingomonas sp. TaxID=28214 RepID=UPI0025ECAFAF|nr:sulfatase-like hydrolase/transferase [Sphingomonas sp.]MBX3563460.1 sulfatase-like hydrolase/transferase [Sphingomonas sp.]
MKLRYKALLGAAALAAGGAYLAKDYVLLHLPGWMAPRVEAFREIAWQAGPDRPAAPAAVRPPNVILIVADDLGFNDISLNGGGVAGMPTPNIDAIARNGMSFSQAYAGNATCAPSRAALLTGRYPTRFGFEFTPTDTRFARTIAGFPTAWEHKTIFDENAAANDPPPDSKGMPASEITIAEQMRSRGYHTLHLGKWHLGGSPGMRPEQQGFDESLGFIIGGQMFLPEHDPNAVNSKQDFDPIDKYIWANLPFSVQYNGGQRFHPDRYMTDYLTHQAERAIDANRNRPFFMYLAYNAPHTPLQALKSDYDALPRIADHRTRVYAAMIRALDRGVGRILAKLRADGLDNNTLVIFTSDNGGAHYIGLPDINRPFRGWKATFFEGGVRVPLLMQWPGHIAPGSRIETPASHFDIFATASAAAGAKLPADRAIDGIDLLSATHAAPRPLFWRSGAYRVVRDGDWKLQLLDLPRQALLYNLKEDPTERRDLAAARPEIVRRLTAEIAAFDALSVKPSWPAMIRSPIAIDRPLGTKPVAGEAYSYWSN